MSVRFFFIMKCYTFVKYKYEVKLKLHWKHSNEVVVSLFLINVLSIFYIKQNYVSSNSLRFNLCMECKLNSSNY